MEVANRSACSNQSAYDGSQWETYFYPTTADVILLKLNLTFVLLPHSRGSSEEFPVHTILLYLIKLTITHYRRSAEGFPVDIILLFLVKLTITH